MIDLAIVGAGAIGATAGYLAARARPDWSILLLERSLAVQGATAYSAGLDFPYGRTPHQKVLSITSQKMYQQFKSEIPSLPIHALPLAGIADRKRLPDILGRFTVNGVHCADRAERAEMMRLLPGLQLHAGQEMVVGCFGAYGFAEQVASCLLAECARSPQFQCWEGVPVTSVNRHAGEHEIEVFDGRRIAAKRVLIATGPWLLSGPGQQVARDNGVRIKKVAALHVLQPPSSDSPIVYFFDEDAFLLPIAKKGKWIFSFTSQDWDCSPANGALHIHQEERTTALGILERYYPEFVPHCVAGRVFCDAYSQDWAPMILPDPERAGVVIAGACSGAGFRLAPAVASAALHAFPDFT